MQVRIKPTRDGTKAMHVSAAAIAMDAQTKLHQLALPVGPTETIKARRERAIRSAGLAPAKGYRLWYGYMTALLAHEYVALCEAYEAHVRHRRNALKNEKQDIEEVLLRERNYEFMGLDQRGRGDRVGAAQDVPAETQPLPSQTRA